jgi:uncharacterized YceG family protein
MERAALEFSYPNNPFLRKMPATPARFEGLFLVGEYSFEKKDFSPIMKYGRADEEAAYANLKLVLGKLLGTSAARFGRIRALKEISPYGQLTLASVVEKEAVGGREYQRVASTFWNRLLSGMGLGSCAATEYALGYHRPFLTFDDVQIKSPYNSYKSKKLPPTPICFVTEDALLAATEPIQTPYYFFVFDWTTGTHYFSANYAEHENKAAACRARFRKKYGIAAEREARRDKFYEY